MTYPLAPGARIAYDQDGSRGFIGAKAAGRGVYEADQTWLEYLNADSGRYAKAHNDLYFPRGNAPVNGWMAVRLATPTHLRGVAFAGAWQSHPTSNTNAMRLLGVLESSQDSTNGEDGTWSLLVNYSSSAVHDFDHDGSASVPDYMFGSASPAGNIAEGGGGSIWAFSQRRLKNNGDGTRGWREVAGSATRQVRWVRFRITGAEGNVGGVGFDGAIFKLHLYGEPDTTASARRLEFVTPSGDFKPLFDWGDVGRGETHTQQFKVRNVDTVQTAEDVTLTLLPTSPNIPEAPQTWVQMSLDGTTWDSVVPLGSLAPGELSDTVTLRLTAGLNLVGPWSPRLAAEVGEWV